MKQRSAASTKHYLYHTIIAYLEGVIRSNPQEGKKLPSVRELCKIFQVSPPTVVKAYSELEAKELVLAVPKSGYFIAKAERCQALDPGEKLLTRIYKNARMPGVIPLSIDAAAKSSGLWPLMQQKLKREGHFEEYNVKNYSLEGDNRLRAAIAYLYTKGGSAWNYDEVLITNSYQVALIAAVKASTHSSHIFVESPCSWATLEILETLGIIPVELYLNDPLPALESKLISYIESYGITSAIFSATINPITGHLPPRSSLKALLELLSRRQISIIETNVYGEIVFTEVQPLRVSYPPRLILCVGNFSKTVSPSCSMGYVLTKSRNHEVLSSIQHAPNTISSKIQESLAQLIMNGSYEKGVANQIQTLKMLMEKMFDLLDKHLPKGKVRFSKSAGGAVIWLEVTNGVDSISLYNALIEKGISIAPGYIFSCTSKYSNCFRISFATDWSSNIPKAIAMIGAQIIRLEHRQD